jgi:alpha,alpha-trehalose phosphorylase
MPILENQEYRYPLEAWRISETRFDADCNLLDETLFALGNGYIGLRGAHEDVAGWPPGASLDGTYLNGFYETEPIHYPETAYGLARQNQFMLNVPNAKRIDLYAGGERFDLLHGTIIAYERALDFRTGILTRSVEWVSPRGRRLAVESRRLVCFEHKHLFAIQYRVMPLNFSGRIRLVASLDGRVRNLEAGDDPRVGSSVSGPALRLREVEQTEDFSALVHRTRNSGLTLVSAIACELEHEGGGQVERESGRSEDRLEQRYELDVAEGQAVSLTRYGTYVSSRDHPESALLPKAREVLSQARSTGFAALCDEQARFLAAFWRQADVEIAGDDALQQGVHFNQFHLLQSIGRDGKTSIAAKGVTGEGYEGHYFWDTEIYVFPVFLFTMPEVARKLLDYRYQGLEKARERARQMSHAKGALYPWRTIAGEECSAYFPAGTAQYHINADIVYSIKLYAEVTGDESFLYPQGAEIVMETARIWMGIGGYIPRKGNLFCINEVTGPDEYSALVNNNYYTHAMAQMHLRYAADVAETMRTRFPEEFSALAGQIELEPDEPARWREAAERMYLPVDEALGIHPQDDSFLSRQVWDFTATPKDHYPLLLHYHPLVIYRYQVCKQADVVLALLLLGDRFSPEEKKRDFDYYEAVTTHDSSLSTCVFSIVASEVGYRDKAYAYFMDTARMDLDNSHANTQYGVHTAAMAGTWMGVVYGFAGMRVYGGSVQFAPYLPEGWAHYQFTLRVQGRLLQVHIDREKAEYRLLAGEPLSITHRGRAIQLTPETPAQAVPV